MPFRRFVQASLVVVTGILMIKLLVNADTRLEVYVIDVAVIFFLGFVVLEGDRARRLTSETTRLDVALAAMGVGADVAANLGLWALGYRASPQPGFTDAIVLILALFLVSYGRTRVRPMIAPVSLLIVLAAITQFISNEDPTFYALVGRYFVALTVWMSAGILSGLGFSVATGADSFRILGTSPLTVQVGIRCGGLDVAAIYTLLIGYFAWQMRLGTASRLGVAVGAGVGALLVNGLRVVLVTILFLHYPTNLVEAFHTNLGDLIFLGYALLFVVGLRRFRAPVPPETIAARTNNDSRGR